MTAQYLHSGMSHRQCSVPSTVMSKLPEFSFSNHIRWQHFVAGVTGGVLSTLIVHPLDLIKIRFQGLHATFLHCYLSLGVVGKFSGIIWIFHSMSRCIVYNFHHFAYRVKIPVSLSVSTRV